MNRCHKKFSGFIWLKECSTKLTHIDFSMKIDNCIREKARIQSIKKSVVKQKKKQIKHKLLVI